MRRWVALLLLCFVAVGDAEGVLTTACDVGAEMAERAAGVEAARRDQPVDDGQSDAPAEDTCHCAHAHLQTVVVAERIVRAEFVAGVAPIAFVVSAPPSADLAQLLRPPRA